jgi:hypothetical protein
MGIPQRTACVDGLLEFQTKPARKPTSATARMEPELTDAALTPPLPVNREMKRGRNMGRTKTVSTQITDATTAVAMPTMMLLK